ncbi:unnamed protein product [Malus baccata var. baccata]
MASFGSLKSHQAHILGLNAYDRHKKFVKDYVSFYGREASSHVKLPVKTDHDTVREGYRLVKLYYEKLFKEYPLQTFILHDMSHYKSGKYTVVYCDSNEVLKEIAFESFFCILIVLGIIYFAGDEAGENKQALVKLVTCLREYVPIMSLGSACFWSKRIDETSFFLKASISASEHRVDDEDDDTDNFEEYLEGMFP